MRLIYHLNVKIMLNGILFLPPTSSNRVKTTPGHMKRTCIDNAFGGLEISLNWKENMIHKGLEGWWPPNPELETHSPLATPHTVRCLFVPLISVRDLRIAGFSPLKVDFPSL